MRFIHTADWHLGRLFHGIHLTDDQRFALDRLVALAEEQRVDAVVVAGDVFDRAVPPTDAVDLLDRTLATLALDVGVQVLVIAGNHDSPARLEYMSEVARRSGVHVVGRVGPVPRSVAVQGGDGTVARFWPLAYTDPETARYELQCGDIHSHEEVIKAHLERLQIERQRVGEPAELNVLVGHAFVTGCRESESERPLSVGGSGAVSADLFADFDYVALGHLHQPQKAGSNRLRYAGSLLKYSFDEAEQRKSVSVVEVVPGAEPMVEELTLPARRDVRRVEGTLSGLITEARPEDVEAYLEVVLTDTEPLLNPVDRLRRVYPHLLSLRRKEDMSGDLGPGPAGEALGARTTLELFAEFFEDVKGSPLSEAQSEVVVEVLGELERAGQERGTR